MAKAQSKGKAKQSTRTKRAPAPATTAHDKRERQPSLPGTTPRARRKTQFLLYLTEEQRELVQRLAEHLSTPWEACTMNAAIRRAFLLGSQSLLATPKAALARDSNSGNSSITPMG